MPIFIPGRQKSYFDDPFGDEEGVREDPEWMLGNKDTPVYTPKEEKNDLPGMPEMPSISDPFEGIPESRPKSTLRTQIEELIKRRPQIDEKPSIAKAIAAGLFGGVQGYLNTSPAKAVHQDPGATDDFVKSLKMGNFEARDRNWGNKLRDLELMDTLEGREKAEEIAQKRAESDEALKKAQAVYYGQKKEIEDNKVEGANIRANIRAGVTPFGKLPQWIQDELNADRPPGQKLEPTDIIPKYLAEQIYKTYNYEQLNSTKKDIAAGNNETKVTTTGMNNQTSTANTEKRVEGNQKVAETRVAGQKSIADTRVNAPAKPRATRAGDVEAEQLRLMTQAEDNHQRLMDKLNSDFGIKATGYPSFADPSKLPPQMRSQYEARKNNLDGALERRREEIHNLAAARKGEGQSSSTGQAPKAQPKVQPKTQSSGSGIPQEVLNKVPEGKAFRAPDGTIYRKVNGKAVRQ